MCLLHRLRGSCLSACLTLQLIDFGLTTHLTSVETLGIGTPEYMAPELWDAPESTRLPGAGGSGVVMSGVINGKKVPYDARKVDIWAMGVTLYVLVAGAYPFQVSACMIACSSSRGWCCRDPSAQPYC